MKKYLVVLFCLLNIVLIPAYAAESFIVRNIEIEGLQRISPDTVLNYLPIKTGDTLSSQKTVNIIRSLYKTGFFEHISLSRSNNTLVIHVEERSTIGKLVITGNSAIPKDKLTTALRTVDVAEGRVYNRATIDKIRQSLMNQYYELGRYNARVNISATPIDRCRVCVKIEISEGIVAKIKRINIIGNHAFCERELLKQLVISTSSLSTFFTQSDRFSQEKLDASLEALRNFYLDHGYVRFAVKSSQAAITPDKKSLYITIVIEEGPLYHVKGVDLTGEFIVPKCELEKLIHVCPGDVFSRCALISAEHAMSEVLGCHGYIYAVISVDPKIDDTCKTVFLYLHVAPGKKVYVRHILFSNNVKTNDVVYRRELTQMEAAIVSSTRLEESKHRLSLRPFVRDVQMTVVPVPNHDDLADINYKVTEDPAAQATVSVGYSRLEHFTLSAGFNQKNFLGTGQTLGLNFTRSRAQQFYGIEFTDPYYTIDGISRTFSLSASKFNPSKVNISRSYATNDYAASMVYGIPIFQETCAINRLNLGVGYNNTLINLFNSVSQQVQTFVNKHGRHFQQLDLIASISRDGRDKAIFPTCGSVQSLGLDIFLPLNSSSLRYYTLAYTGHYYHPIASGFIFTARGELGYGNAFNGVLNFPFFKNYYAGGIDSVRGYQGNTLGPLDNLTYPTGGNFLAAAGVGLIFPNHISDSLRTTLFFDAGNVYNTFDNRIYNGSGSGPIRLSAGVEADWLSPLGLINVSLGKPLNKKRGDTQEIFQFSLGANFG